MTLIVELPRSLEPIKHVDLVRLGRNLDGGYVVEKGSIIESGTLLSFGLNDEWSFELDYIESTKNPVIAFDGSISSNLFAKRAFKSALSLVDMRRFSQHLKTYLSYRALKKRASVYELFVGPAQSGEYLSFDEVLELTPDTGQIFLKMDIEGWEYRLLDNISTIQNRLSGIVIEFHDADLNLSKIERFAKQLDLSIVFVHVNNFSPVTLEKQPLTIEISFARSPEVDANSVQRALRFKNNPNGEEISCRFI